MPEGEALEHLKFEADSDFDEGEAGEDGAGDAWGGGGGDAGADGAGASSAWGADTSGDKKEDPAASANDGW
jgi:hypothetical protein